MTEGGAGPLVRKFVLRTNEDAQRMYAFLKQNREPLMEQGRALQVVISEHKASRSTEANKYLWGALLTPIADQAWVGGRKYAAELWNEYLKEKFLPDTNARGMDKHEYLPDGSRRLVMSSSHLNVEEMRSFCDQIAAYASTELGVALPANPRDL